MTTDNELARIEELAIEASDGDKTAFDQWKAAVLALPAGIDRPSRDLYPETNALLDALIKP